MKTADSCRLLVYAQDIGGANFILPVLQEILAKHDSPGSAPVDLLIHPHAERFFAVHGLGSRKQEAMFKTLPVSVGCWRDYLAGKGIDRIFCTTSSPYRDLSNCNLIIAARRMGIPVLGVMDHWKGFERFFVNEEPRYLPDQICCIDDTCREILADMGLSPRAVHVVGHPGLERVSREAVDKKENACARRILLVSQPVVRDMSFEGFFFQRVGECRLIDRLAEICNHLALDGRPEVHIRPHPKELSGEALPAGIRLDPYEDWEVSRKNAQVFIGRDSMALVEASLSGGYCISLALPEIPGATEQLFPAGYTCRIGDLADLTGALVSAFQDENGTGAGEMRPFYKGSVARTLRVLALFRADS